MKLGIIPAGGNAERFGGCYKDMLPINNSQLLIDRCIEAERIGGADCFLVITSKDKHAMHHHHLGDGYYFCLKAVSLWKSIVVSFAYDADWYFFGMPDTYFPTDTFLHLQEKDFNLGTHTTTMPRRFGVIQDGQICDKCDLAPGYYQAWGALAWTREVVNFWKSQLDEIKDFTHAFNLAMQQFGYHTHRMDYYRDMASWDDYRELVRELL